MFWSRWLKPGPARPKPGLGQILEIWEPGNPEVWNPTNLKNGNSQNPNPCRPKCRQGLDWPEKEPPGPIWGHPRPFSPWTETLEKKNVKHLLIFLGGPMGPIHPVWGHVLVSFCCYWEGCNQVSAAAWLVENSTMETHVGQL